MISHGPGLPSPQASSSETPAEMLRAAYRALRAIGFSESEAGNLSAHIAGLAQTRQGWSIREMERLMFIRSLVDTGRIAR